MSDHDFGDRPTPEDIEKETGIILPGHEPTEPQEEKDDDRVEFGGEILYPYRFDSRNRPIVLDKDRKAWLLLQDEPRKLVPLCRLDNGNLGATVAVPAVVGLVSSEKDKEKCTRKAKNLAWQMMRRVWPDAEGTTHYSVWQRKPKNMLTRMIRHVVARYDLGVKAPPLLQTPEMN